MSSKKKEKTVSKKSTTKAAPKRSTADFHHSVDEFQDLLAQCFKRVKKLGGTSAAAHISEDYGTHVSVRMGALETLERTRDKSLGVTVYVGQQKGNASTSDFSKKAIRDTVQAAYDIARYTAADPFAALPDTDTLCSKKKERNRDLKLCHPWNLTPARAIDIATACEDAALGMHPLLTNSDGASVSAAQGHFHMAHWHEDDIAFMGGYPTSRHSISVAPIAKRGDDMQRDYWYSSQRNPKHLAAPEAVGRYAAERTLARLGARKLSTRQCPVLFESTLAAGLLGSFVQAVSGGALYRKTSFLVDSIGTRVFPKHISIYEDPFIKQAKGSSPFDAEGVRVRARHVVEDGEVQGYFLSSYSARKLGMTTTGNAGGSHNLELLSTLTQAHDDLPEMLRKLGTGLFVTELMGQGVNYVTGDYSRGAAGYWVENGEIAYPVHEITIAGKLQDMFAGIAAIGADTYTYGAKTTGSVLIDRMTVAGN